jgi:arabinogalactan oligomer/maltooligosaccharide transport system permease protein
VDATAASNEPAPEGMRTTAWSLPSRAVATFSGPAGLAVKIGLLSVVNAIAIWALVILLQRHSLVAAGILLVVTAAIDALYLVPNKAVPAKFLVPGTVFLIAFQLIPIIYTINVAFTNWSTGHIINKPAAIKQIRITSLAESANGKSYTIAPAKDKDGRLVLLMVDDTTGATYVGSSDSLKPVPKTEFSIKDAVITGAAGYTLLKGADLNGIDSQLAALVVPSGGQNGIRPQGLDTAVELHPTLRYDAARDVFVRISNGTVFSDNGRGSYVAAGKKEELEPGWKTSVGFSNFSRMIHSSLVRGPFIRVFIWTLAFATLTVLISFFMGLFLAITLNKPGLRFRWAYRSAIVLPYAMPAFLSLLIWRGLFNDDFGVVNKLLHAHIPWLFDPNWAKVAVLLVSTWMTIPYFFLISLAALQSIPNELIEAAKVDGASGWQNFRKVVLPLLLIAVAPLMIASFAFNFNNFGNIYLLTGGGPAQDNSPVAGATDILISYSYKIAFAAGKGQDYGLASAMSFVIFFIVGTISAITFSRTKALESLA